VNKVVVNLKIQRLMRLVLEVKNQVIIPKFFLKKVKIKKMKIKILLKKVRNKLNIKKEKQ
jgi:hypothetical protein